MFYTKVRLTSHWLLNKYFQTFLRVACLNKLPKATFLTLTAEFIDISTYFQILPIKKTLVFQIEQEHSIHYGLVFSITYSYTILLFNSKGYSTGCFGFFFPDDSKSDMKSQFEKCCSGLRKGK